MKKIIVPVDFSDTSGAALRFGTFLAEVMDLDLSVVHVFDANFSFAQAISTGAMLAEKERLEKLLSEFVERHVYPVLATFQGNMTTLPAINTEVYEGFPSGIIRTLSDRADTEMMVLGGVGAGQSSTPPGLFGGVAQSLALGGSCLRRCHLSCCHRQPLSWRRGGGGAQGVQRLQFRRSCLCSFSL